MSWLSTRDGYLLVFSRDERATRAAAKPPRVFERGSGRFIAPIDPQGGGSWLGVNERGMAICLLNRPSRRRALASRGRLLLKLAVLPNAAGVERALRAAELACYGPFTLGVFVPPHAPRCFDWTGARLVERRAATCPLTSSSRERARVTRLRRQAFRALISRYAGGAGLEALLEFHRSRSAALPAASVALRGRHRRTVSVSVVEVTREAVRFEYHAGFPATLRCGAGVRVALRRRGA